MSFGEPSTEREDWVSASDIAEYTFCPRALYYRRHPPTSGPLPDAVRSAARGSEFHARRLPEMERVESAGAAWWWLGAAALLLALGVAVWLTA